MVDCKLELLFSDYTEKFILCTGAKDKLDRLILSFPDVKYSTIQDNVIESFIDYFCNKSIITSHEEFILIIDRRSDTINSLKELLNIIEKSLPRNVKEIHILKPQGFFVDSLLVKQFRGANYPKINFCNSFQKLEIFIERDQLLNALALDTLFDFTQWKYFRQATERLLNISRNVLTKTKEFLASVVKDVPQQNSIFSYKSYQNIQDNYYALKKRMKTIKNQANILRMEIRKSDDENISSLTLSVNQLYHIISIERTLNSLQSCLESLDKFQHFYTHIRSTVQPQLDFDYEYSEVLSYLSYWELLIMSAKEYFPGQPGAPTLAKMKDNATNLIYLPESPSQIVHDQGDSMRNLFSIFDKIKETCDQASSMKPKLEELLKLAKSIHSGQEFNQRDFTSDEEGNLSDGNNNKNLGSSENHSRTCSICRNPRGSDEEILSYLKTTATHSIGPIKKDINQRIEILTRLVSLANDYLPKITEQMTLVFGLFEEMQNCCYWIQYGERICKGFTVDNLTDELSQLTMSKSQQQFHLRQCSSLVNIPQGLSNEECAESLDEIDHFLKLKNVYITNLTNPKTFHRQYAKFFSNTINSDLTVLLSKVEQVQSTIQLISVQLQQRISRQTLSVSFPEATSNPTEPRKNGKKDDFENYQKSYCDEVYLDRYGDSYQMVWNELIDTERRYVKFLNDIYEVYWVNNPPLYIFESKKLLGNWQYLLDFHKNISYPELRACSGSPAKIKEWADRVVHIMIDHYSVYCSVYESLVIFASSLEKDNLTSSWMTERQEVLNYRELGPDSKPLLLPLKSRLITPIQRFQKYHLLLDRMLKYCCPNDDDKSSSDIDEEDYLKRDVQDLTSAHETMLKMCETVNIIMRFRGCNMSPSQYGFILLQDSFSLIKEDSRINASSQRNVFLFQNCVVLTKYRQPGCIPSNTNLFSSLYLSGPGVTSEQITYQKDQLIPSSAIFLKNSPPPKQQQQQSSLTNKQTAIDRRSSWQTVSQQNSDLVASVNSRQNSSFSSFSSNSSVPLIASQQLPSSQGANNSIFERCAVYEVKVELPLSEFGLTSSYKDDKRRFALWRSGRSETFIFQHNNPATRELWTEKINQLLMTQLVQMRNNANTFRNSQKDEPTRSSSDKKLPTYQKSNENRMDDEKTSIDSSRQRKSLPHSRLLMQRPMTKEHLRQMPKAAGKQVENLC